MRNLFLIPVLALLALAVQPAMADETETFKDTMTGLRVKLPDGWDRDTRVEGGATRFAAKLDIGLKKYVLFQITAGPSKDFESESWLAQEKQKLTPHFGSVSQSFQIDKSNSVGGKSAPLFSISGKAKQGFDLRIRGCGIVNGPVFFRIVEMSYNGAHAGQDASLAALWKAISFKPGQVPVPGRGGERMGGDDGDGDGEANADKAGAAKGSPTTVEDKTGNLKLVLPAGWELRSAPPESATQNLRLVAVRLVDGQGVGTVEIYKFARRPETFSIGTPTDEVQGLLDGNMFATHFGMATGKTLRPRTDESILLGDSEKSGQYVIERLGKDEQEEIEKAETLKRRGEKIEIPTFKKRRVIGRVALLSPYLYLVKIYLPAGAAQNAQLVAESKKLLDSFEFYNDEPMPLHSNVAGEGTNTRETRKDERKETVNLTLSGKRPYRLEIKFTVPPGIEAITDRAKLGGANASVVFFGQDAKNNWIEIQMSHASHNQAGERNRVLREKKLQFGEWATQWDSKARGTKIPRKPQSVNLRIKGIGAGKGYKKLEGKIEGHRGTFAGFLKDKKGWRHFITIESRGDGDKVFEAAIKALFKSMRISVKK